MERVCSRFSALSLAVLALVCLAQGAGARELPSGSSTWNGRTTTVRGEANGTRTRTTTNHQTGKTTTSNSANDKVGGSCYNPSTGETTSSYRNTNGTRTITVSDENSRTIKQRVAGQAAPAPKPPVLIIQGRIVPAKKPVTPCKPVTPPPAPRFDPGDPRSWDTPEPIEVIM